MNAYIQYDTATGNVLCLSKSVSAPALPAGIGFIPAPAGITTLGATPWSVVNGALTARSLPAASQAQLWAEYQAKAQAALSKSDDVILLCVEDGLPVPLALKSYRAALRAIIGAVSGDPSKPLPTAPAE